MDNIFESDIAQANEYYLDNISLEARANPFKTISDGIKRNLHSVVSSIPVFDPTDTKQNEIGENFAKFSEAADSNTIKNLNHLHVKDINVTVPVGFTGDYPAYFEVLIRQLHSIEDITKTTIVPAHNLILKYVGKPETMMSIDNADLAKIKLRSDDIEKFKKDMNRFFDPKRSNQSLPIGKLVANKKQLETLLTNVSSEVVPWMLNDKWRNDVFKSYIKLQESLDLLLVRIEQKPEVYQLSKLNAERLARLVNDIAVEIELTGALFTYINQFITCMVNMQFAIYTAITD